MKKQDSISKLQRAQRKVDRLKGFYNHLTVFVIINLIIIVVKVYDNLNSWDSFMAEFLTFNTLSTFIVWGLILGIHAFTIFILPRLLGYDWEERKIQQLMEDELKRKQY